MDKTQAQNLLDLLAARPDKADLIEALAREAGLLPSLIPSAAPITDPEWSTTERKEEPVKTEKRAPKKTSAAEEKKEKPKRKSPISKDRRHLTPKEREYAKHLLDHGWSNLRLAAAVGAPPGSVYGARKGTHQMNEECIAKLMKLQPKDLKEAAE